MRGRLLLSYLAASHCFDPGTGHYASLARGQRPNPHCSRACLAHLHSHPSKEQPPLHSTVCLVPTQYIVVARLDSNYQAPKGFGVMMGDHVVVQVHLS